jgi:magnesium transporter
MIQSRKLTVLLDSVKKLIRRNDYKHVANILRKIHAADIAQVLRNLLDAERIRLVRVLCDTDMSLAADSISELGVELGGKVLSLLPDSLATKILQEMETDDAAELIASLPEEQGQKILELMSFKESASVRDLLHYEEETAGRIMNKDVLSLNENVTVSEAIRAIQERQESAAYFYIYVVDDRAHLVGVVSLKQLLLRPPQTCLHQIMRTNVISVQTETDQEEVARQVANYNLLSMPVVDGENKLVGMITVDDIIDVIKEEATEDIFYLAGVEADDHTYSTPGLSIKKRIPWLAAYLFIGLFTAWVISLFRGTLDRYVILALFMPMVGGMGGSAGNQTMTVTVRGLAVGELTPENRSKFVWKEIRVGMINGFFLGIIAGVISASLEYLWSGKYSIGPIMFVAMWINISLANLWGSLIPQAFKWLKIDPALASGIFVATLNDIAGFSLFLGLATVLFHLFGI